MRVMALFIPRHTIVAGYYGFMLDVHVSVCLCILCHQGFQLILAYSWARPAILIAGKGRGGMFLFLLFLHFHSCSSFFHVPLFYFPTVSSISFLPISGRQLKVTTKVDVSLNPNTIDNNPSIHFSFPDDNLSRHQWIFTKLGMCIDIVEIWFGIANGQIS